MCVVCFPVNYSSTYMYRGFRFLLAHISTFIYLYGKVYLNSPFQSYVYWSVHHLDS